MTTAPTERSADTTPPTAGGVAAVADEFFGAIERGDVATIERLYHPDARIWHNYDQVEQGVVDNLKVLGYLCRVLEGRRYDEVRRVVLDDGFVQQHVLRGTAARGTLEIPAMMRVWVHAGRITRIEEYLDPAPTAILRG